MRDIREQGRSNAVLGEVDFSQSRLTQKFLEFTNNRAVRMKRG